ncbi:MAG TPA: ricin-type beta-trefoil lectin domain protein [Candidatus Saccharimonadales bacterium]|nr:ricin-type beta-trefoil lectin domain protein [Candidatus Saccharimonadales bacterium]
MAVKKTSRPKKSNPPVKKKNKVRRPISHLLTQRSKLLMSIGAGLVLLIVGAFLLVSHAASSSTGPIVGKAGKCLDNDAQHKTDGNKIQLYGCNGTAAQQWRVNSNGTITNANGYCLDVQGGGKVKGTLVQLYHCLGTANQKWKVDSGNKTIINSSSGLCLDDKYSSTANGNQIWTWDCNGTDAQKWTVETDVAGLPGASAPCDKTAAVPPAHYDHVIWILEENRSLNDVIGSSQAPYLTKLAHECGYSTKFVNNEPISELGAGYHSVVHYVADLAGSNCVTGNGKTGHGCLLNSATYGPGKYDIGTESILDQLTAAHLSWKSYQEAAPHNCTLSNSAVGNYAPWHDGVLYFTRSRNDCKKFDVPFPELHGSPRGALIDDIKNDRLPNFAYITPDLNDDMHNKGPSNADNWLQAYLPALFESKTYQEGRTAVFIIWDEARANNDPLPNLVIAPTVHTGAIHTTMSGFAVLGTTEDMFGLTRLGCATGTPPGKIGQCFPGATANMRQAYSL